MIATDLSEHCGAEVEDIDLANATAEEIAAIRTLCASRGVVVVRAQHLSPEQQIAFAERFGPISINKLLPALPGYPRIAEVKKTPEQKSNIGGGWHTDHSYEAAPAMGSILVARVLPPSGGDTIFLHMGAVHDALPDDLRTAIASKTALHSFERQFGRDGLMRRGSHGATLKGADEQLQAIHPTVIAHPMTGRPILYVNPAFTEQIDGLSYEDSSRLLHKLYAFARSSGLECIVKWQPGTIAIWDNRTTWHRALNDYQGELRVMHRITIAGTPLEAAA